MPFLAIAALATAAVATGVSLYEGEKAASAQKDAVNLQRQQADLQNARQQRDAVRQARAAMAQASQAAENQNVGLSSSAQGGQGSIISQVNSNLSFLDQYGRLTDQAQDALGRAVNYEASSKMFGQVAGLGMTVFQNSPDINHAFSKVFQRGS